MTRNPYAFLTAARSKEMATTIWIGTICINRRDIPELNELVKKSAKI
jgi:hypothetical protein